MTGIKQSNFTQVTSVDENDNIPLFTRSENKRITYEDMRNQLADEIAVRFIYPTTAQLQQSNLEADEDEPNYVRCEETEYRLYKITALAAGVDDIALDNGMTATYQEEYSKSGFVLGAASSTNNALALFDGTTGTQLKTGAVLSTIGGNLASATSIAQVSYPRVDAANAVTMATPTVMKTDLNLPSNTAASISNIESDISTIENDIVTIEGDIVDINSDLSAKVKTVETFAALATTAAPTAGMIVYLKQHTSGGLGGGHFQDTSGSITNDGGTLINNSVTSGRHWKRVNYDNLTLEMFGCIRSGDEHTNLQAAIEVARARGLSLYGEGSYTSSGQLTIEEYDTAPPVFMHLNKCEIIINQLTYTGTSNAAIHAKSAQARVSIRRLIGPSAGAGLTSGLKISGLGDAHHDIGWVSGFTNNIDLDEAFSHSVTVGWSDDAIRGVRINASNECKIHGGRIGGPFVTTLNAASCEIGIDVISGASNKIYSNVEYCRRSDTAIGIRDNGTGTQFVGYTESCSAYNIQATGRDGVFNVIAGGTNRDEESKYFAGFSNKIQLTSQIDAGQEAVSGANSTLTNMLLQAFEAESSGEIIGPRGFTTKPRLTEDASNLILDSSDFQGASWSSNALGSASWGAVTISDTADVYSAGGYRTGTNFIVPSLPDPDDIYRITQSGVSIPVGLHTYGVWARCESGDIDIMCRIVYDTSYQVRSMTRLTASDGFVRISSEDITNRSPDVNATFEISFRTKTGATLTLFNAHVINAWPCPLPSDNLAAVRELIGGEPISGNMATNGFRVNGMEQSSISPSISSGTTLTAGNISYRVYVISGGSAKNILLEPSYQGCKITFKRDGVAGTVNVLPSATTIDGSAASVSITTAWATLSLIYDETLGWLTV